MINYKLIIQGLNIRPNIGAFGYSTLTLLTDGKENILFDVGGYGVRKIMYNLLNEIKIYKVFIFHSSFRKKINNLIKKLLKIFHNIFYIYQDVCSSNHIF